MKTKFEESLKKHRASLDVEEPDDDFIWSGIQAELKPKQSFQFLSWKAVAIILLALMSGFVLNSVLNRTPGHGCEGKSLLSRIPAAFRVYD